MASVEWAKADEDVEECEEEDEVAWRTADERGAGEVGE